MLCIKKICPLQSVWRRSDARAYVFSVLALTSTDPAKALRVPSAVLQTIPACMTRNTLQKEVTFRIAPLRHPLPAAAPSPDDVRLTTHLCDVKTLFGYFVHGGATGDEHVVPSHTYRIQSLKNT